MKIMPASAAVFIFSIVAFSPSSFTEPYTRTAATKIQAAKDPKIQVAVLLDVSGSMSGLIEQAKAQLWNMLSVMGRAKCENGIPKIEIALYVYGQGDKGIKNDYIKQVTPFSSDLDQLSQELFKLSTSGSEEYCGKVIYTSLDELSWDANSSNYKVVFIAGNESFLQGDINYTQACGEAKKKGVIVNTIYCGDRMEGIKLHWNLNGECGNGSYTNIDHNAKGQDIATPYDSTLVVLNNKLNTTYLYYGAQGEEFYSRQYKMDRSNANISKEVAAKRTAVKGKKELYNNASWDIVDAYAADSTRFMKSVDKKTLPDSLKNKRDDELQQIVKEKSAERGAVQKEILQVSSQREAYIAAERAKAAKNNTAATLETEVERIIKEQVKRFNMYIE
ncbi:MAG TPA: vWA domain-containing protein [Chitinophagaceae bacterium]